VKVLVVGTELFHADLRPARQAGMTKLIVTFHNFTNASKNE